MSPRFMDRKQFLALLRATRATHHQNSVRDYHLWLFLGNSGLRISEALQLVVPDLRLREDPAWVRVRSLKQNGERLDAVLLDAKTARAMRRWVRQLKGRFGHFPAGEVPVFPALVRRRLGCPPSRMSRANAYQLFRRYAHKAELPREMTLHSLRHYRATTLYQTTRDLEFVKQQLRHRKLSSTQVYLSISPARARKYLIQLEKRPRT